MLGGEKSTPSMRRPVRVNLFFLFSFSFFILSASYFPFNQVASVAILACARFVERFSLGASWALQSVLLLPCWSRATSGCASLAICSIRRSYSAMRSFNDSIPATAAPRRPATPGSVPWRSRDSFVLCRTSSAARHRISSIRARHSPAPCAC